MLDDDDLSLSACIVLLVIALLFIAIMEQIVWLKDKAVYGTDDCFWKECVVMVEKQED